MTLFRRSGTLNRSRRPSRDWQAETMPPRPPEYRPPAERPEVWGGGTVRGMQGDPCGSGPIQDASSDEEVA